MNRTAEHPFAHPTPGPQHLPAPREAEHPGSLTPAAARLRLGRLLRHLRERAGRTQAESAQVLECTKPKISKIETGKATIGPGDVRLLLSCYGVRGDSAEALLDLARQARKRNHVPVPEWAQRFVALESIATSIEIYSAELVPALLRTDDYARALGRATEARPADVRRAAAVLADRRALLSRSDPPELAVVLNEAVLRRPVGGPAVLRDQLRRLRELAELPHVAVQVLPFDAGAHPAMSTSFHLLRADRPEPVAVVHLEQLLGSTYLDAATQVDWYTRTFASLRQAALPPQRTAELLDRLSTAEPW